MWENLAGSLTTTTSSIERLRNEEDMKRSKKYTAAAEKVKKDHLYTPLEAVTLAKETTTTKYDSTIEVALVLGVDPKKADQAIRSTVNLPHGTGKTARVLVFANGERAEEARAAGADIVGGDDLIDEVSKGRLDFDAFVSKPAEILFKDFVPGEVYKKRFTITNVSYTFNSFKMLNLSDDVIDFFVITFEKPGRMSAGVSCPIDIVFTPKVNQDIKTTIKLLTGTGPVEIPLICLIKR
jgi:hypothetical protein